MANLARRIFRGLAFAMALSSAIVLAEAPASKKGNTHPPRTFIATAHSQDGISASGLESEEGTVAADPKVLPLGSLIRVTGAGRYSGTYHVIDTGAKVNGRHIDIYIPDSKEARRFGRRRVTVQLLKKGELIEARR